MRKRLLLLVRVAFCLVVALALLWVGRGVWLPIAGHALEVSSPLRKADAIYVFAGGELERAPYAAKLFHRGFAPEIITGASELSSSLKSVGMRLDEAHLNAWSLMRNGVPSTRITILPYGTSTLEEAIQLRDFARARRFHRLILVSSPFHMRRVAMTARRIFRGTGIELIYAPCRPALVDLSAWWRTESGLITVQNEYLKLALYRWKFHRGWAESARVSE